MDKKQREVRCKNLLKIINELERQYMESEDDSVEYRLLRLYEIYELECLNGKSYRL